MLKYSFMSKYSKNTEEEARNLLITTDKPIKYTFGLKMRNPTTNNVEISNEEALNKFDANGLSDVTEYTDYIDFNQYSGNDLF